MLVALPRVAIDLREERGTKTDEYDIDVWLGQDRPWSIEVKTRSDSASYSAKALNRTLDKARTQLPANALGTIFVKVPTPWLIDADYRRENADVVSTLLAKTGRVHAIVFVWDEWIPRDSGLGVDWGRSIRVFRADHIDDNLSHVLDFYERSWNAPWDFGPIAPF